MQLLNAAMSLLLVMISTPVMADEPTLVLDPRTVVPSGPFDYEVLDALFPVTSNLVRQMDACFARGNGSDPGRIRVLVSLDEDGNVTDVQPHPAIPSYDKLQLKAALESIINCGPFDNGGRPDVYRLLDIVLVDTGS